MGKHIKWLRSWSWIALLLPMGFDYFFSAKRISFFKFRIRYMHLGNINGINTTLNLQKLHSFWTCAPFRELGCAHNQPERLLWTSCICTQDKLGFYWAQLVLQIGGKHTWSVEGHKPKSKSFPWGKHLMIKDYHWIQMYYIHYSATGDAGKITHIPIDLLWIVLFDFNNKLLSSI